MKAQACLYDFLGTVTGRKAIASKEAWMDFEVERQDESTLQMTSFRKRKSQYFDKRKSHSTANQVSNEAYLLPGQADQYLN